MNYRPYAIVLHQNKNGTAPATLVAQLMNHLKKKGRTKLLPRILRELKRLRDRDRLLLPRLEVAHEHEKSEALRAAKALGFTLEQATVNTTLIRGWRVRGEGRLVDRSAKRALVNLYKNITNA